MYIGKKKILFYVGNKKITFFVPPEGSDIIVNVIDNPITLTIDDIMPIRIDVYPLDTDIILPVVYIDDPTIADVKMFTIIPKKEGTTNLTVYTPDGKTLVGKIPLTITSFQDDFIVEDSEIYNVDLSTHSISNDGITESCDRINTMLIWAKNNGYKKVIMPEGTYLIGSDKSVKLLSDMILDLGGSTLQQEASTGNNITLVKVPSGTSNCRLINGTLRGDRESRDTTDNTEFVHGIVSQGNKVKLKNLTIEQFLGYGIAIGYGDRKAMAYISKDNLTEVSTNNWSSIDYINISNFSENIMICNPFGYGGWGSIKDTSKFNIRFYDVNKSFISEVKMIKPYREVSIPNGAKYVMLDLNDTTVGNGNSDFGNSIAFLAEFYPSDYLDIDNCNIQNCKSLGIAYSGAGTHNVFRNCTFANNGGANATADIDLEDGWEFMRCLVIRDCIFNGSSTRSFVQCAGESVVLYNNTFEGAIGISERTINTRIIDNEFNYSTTKHVDINTEWYSGACFIEGNTFTNAWCVWNNMRDNETLQRFYFKDNTFTGGGVINNSKYEVFKNLKVSSSTSLNGKIEDITIK